MVSHTSSFKFPQKQQLGNLKLEDKIHYFEYILVFEGFWTDNSPDMKTIPLYNRTKKFGYTLIASLLTTSLLLLGGVSPAHAASPKITQISFSSTQSHSGKTPFYGTKVNISPAWKSYRYYNGQVATLKLERKVGNGKWTKVSQKNVKLPLTTAKTTFTAPAVTSTAATTKVSYRIVSLKNSYVKKTTTAPAVTVTYKYRYPNGIPLGDLYYNNTGGFAQGGETPNGVTFKVRVGGGTYSYYSKDKGQLQLQRKIGDGKWAVLKTTTITLPTTEKNTTFDVPAYSTSKAKETVYYRILSLKKGNVDKATTSKTLKVTYVNQGKYTGQIKKYYDMAKTYCPTAVVAIKDDLEKQDAAGLYRSGTHQIYVDDSVASYSETNQRSVMLHECAHLQQWKMAGVSSKVWDNYFINDSGPTPGTESVANFKALEHAADCAAKSLNPTGYLGYNGYCNSKELDYGKQIMSGKKWW